MKLEKKLEEVHAQRVAQAVVAHKARTRAIADEESPELPRERTRNRSGERFQSHPKSSPKQRGESSEQGHAVLDRSEVERFEAHRVREEFTAWCKTQSSDLTVAVETGSEEKAVQKASFDQLGATSESIRTKIRELVERVTTTKELESEIQSLSAEPNGGRVAGHDQRVGSCCQ